MTTFEQTILLAFLAGAMIPLGGLAAAWERIQPRWLERELRHGLIAFGGGALLAAVALVMVPEGSRRVAEVTALVLFLAGGLSFMVVDIWLYRRRTRRAQLIAMLLDFVPESMALGAALITGGTSGKLLAFLIGLQNLPEGFNAFREMRSRYDTWHVLLLFCLLSLVGPLAAWFGATALAGHPAVLGGVMLYSSGGILYLIFQDIAPQAVLRRHWAPPLGAVAGFALGLLGHLLTR